MRLGIVDLGTNSVRFAVYELRSGKKLLRLHREKAPTRLGTGVFTDRRLDKLAVKRTLRAFERFRRIADELRATRIVAVATSVLREAHDAEDLIQSIRDKTGIRVRVISGAEEARLIARGVLENEVSLHEHFALIDIGGGSTEITICRRNVPKFTWSFPLGSSRLNQLFLIDPDEMTPRDRDIEKLREYTRVQVHKKLWRELRQPTKRVVGSGGTIKAICRIVRKCWGEEELSLRRLTQLVAKISRMTPAKLKDVPGMDPTRLDIILSGALLLEELMHTLGAKVLVPTSYSLRDGLLAQEVESDELSRMLHS